MSALKWTYEVDGSDFTRAGEASSNVKKKLRALGVPSDVIRKVSIALYEGEINMVIHANGGVIDVEMSPDRITMVLKDTGKGIPTLIRRCRRDIRRQPTRCVPSASAPGWGCPI